ncbi:MAG: hypothetical protein ABL879_13380 [Devosia sp.]
MNKLLITVTAFAMLTAPAFAWGAHNPSQVDHPDIPNCTIMDGPNNYANNPNCETVPGALSSSVSGTGSSDDCRAPAAAPAKLIYMVPIDYCDEQ